VILARRWLAAQGSQRQALAPVLVSGDLVMALLAVWYAALLADADQDSVQALDNARYVVMCTVPFAFLRRSRGWPSARRSPSTSRRRHTSACPTGWSRRPTSSSPRR
jgi:hypothetical protein